MKLPVIFISQAVIYILGGGIFCSRQKFNFMNRIVLVAMLFGKSYHFFCNSSFSILRANKYLGDFWHIFIVAKRFLKLNADKAGQNTLLIIYNNYFLPIVYEGVFDVFGRSLSYAVKFIVENI